MLAPPVFEPPDELAAPAAAAQSDAPAAEDGKERWPFDEHQHFDNFVGCVDDYDVAALFAPSDDDDWREQDLRAHERRVLAARRQPAFCDRLAELLAEHPTLPLVRSAARLHWWLDELAQDPEAEAASYYFTLSRGFFLLPLGTDFPRYWGSNYASCNAATAEIDREFARICAKKIIAPWHIVAAEAGLSHLERPDNIMSISVVLKRGKTRVVIDASRPDGASLNDLADLPPTRLANIFMAMRAFCRTGQFWLADEEDAFYQSPLSYDSRRLAGICWRGQIYAFRRSFFGFKAAPHLQQTQSIALIRITTRRLRRRGLPCGDPPGWDLCWASANPDTVTTARRGERTDEQPEGRGADVYNRGGSHHSDALVTILGYLDDFWGSASTPRSAAFSFLHFLAVCHAAGIRLKPSKVVPPTRRGLYLGVWCDLDNMTVSIDSDRVADLTDKLLRLLALDSVTVGDLMSVVGVLVFCAIIIPAARCFYRRLLDALRVDNARRHRFRRLRWTPGMREDVELWLQILRRYNGRAVSRGVSDPVYPYAGYSDASFLGWGWHLADGADLYDRGTWPASWLADRIGPHSAFADIYIVELELWATLKLLRAAAPLAAGGRFKIFSDNQSVCAILAKLSTRSRRCLPLLKEIVGLLVVYQVSLIVGWVDTKSNEHADLLSRWADLAEDKAAILRRLTELRRGNRHRLGPADRRRPLRPDLADLFPTATMDEFAAAADVSADEAADLRAGDWTAPSPLVR